VQNQLEKSFSSAAALAQQYPQYASGITVAAKTSFLKGADWAYGAGIIATVVGIALVFLLFPSKAEEERLLGEYEHEEARQEKAATTGGVG
jgi:hypothetical protein